MGCVSQKPQKYKDNSKTTTNNIQSETTTVNNQRSDSQVDPPKATVAKFPQRVKIPSLENKQVVILNDHFLKQAVQVPVLQPVDHSTLFAKQSRINKMRTLSLNSPQNSDYHIQQFGSQKDSQMKQNNRQTVS